MSLHEPSIVQHDNLEFVVIENLPVPVGRELAAV
jgi:hypothetical protein